MCVPSSCNIDFKIFSSDPIFQAEINNKPFPFIKLTSENPALWAGFFNCKLLCLKNQNLNLGMKRSSKRKFLSNWVSNLSNPIIN